MKTKKPWLKFYDNEVPKTVDIPEYTLSDLLFQSAKKYPKHIALIYFGKTIRYKKLNALVNRFAKNLLDAGIKRGDKVALQLPNCPQFVIAYYGILRAGCVAVPVNPLYTGKDLQFILNDSGAKAAITFTKNYRYFSKAKSNTSVKVIIVTNIKEYFPKPLNLLFTILKERKEGHYLKEISDDTVTWKQFLKNPKNIRLKTDASPHALAVLQYTGGTTGIPKGAMLTHNNLVANVWQIKYWYEDLQEGREIFIAALPYFHVYGMTACLNLPIALGSQIVLFPQVDIKKILESINKYRPTIFPGIPAIYAVLNNVKDIGNYNLKSIRTCVCGAAALPKEVKNKFEKLTGALLVEGYGLTEASPVTHCNPLKGKQKECIGIPLPSTDAKIIGLEKGEDLKIGEVGELAVKGPQIMKGYYKADNETDTCIKDGWLLTGDIAYMDEDGFFHIVDRKKDLIITSGLNVYPKEVEDIISEHKDVKECVVVGNSHKSKGETITAYVVKKDGIELSQTDLSIHCKQELPAYKRPKSFVFIDEIPKTLIGKPLRRELKKER